MKRYIIDAIGVIFGSLVTAVGLNALLIPNIIASGGASGIATILFHLFGLSPGLMMLAINIPLLLTSALMFGVRFGTQAFLGAITTSLGVQFTSQIPVLTNDPLLAAIYGGIITGIGIGIVFRFNGSTGGTDLAAKILSHFSGWKISDSLLSIDALIVISAGLIFSAEYAMYALIAIFATAKMIDVVQEGLYAAKALIIISERNEKIASILLSKLSRGVTIFPSRGAYSGTDSLTLLCVVSRSELSMAKNLVLSIDRQAFVVVTDAHEVLGEGFTSG
ncbi:MAG: YitT family protein [bacterium]|nr:YitT family protein [bacterium]